MNVLDTTRYFTGRTKCRCLQIFAAAAVTIPLWMLFACKSTWQARADQGLLLSATVSAKEYMMDLAHASGSGDEMVVFPFLEVYNSSGLLVYTSTNSTRNVKMLQNLSDGLRHFQPVPVEMPLVKLVEAFPEFRARKEELLRGHHPAVVSVDLAGCEGCSIQAEALDAMRGELREQSFNLLLIHVRQP